MLGERTALVDAVQRHISDVHPDVRALWRDLLASVPPHRTDAHFGFALPRIGDVKIA
jgi:hypothetical protein